MRLRLVGVDPKHLLWFEAAMFRSDRAVAWGSSPLARIATAIPDKARVAIEKLKGHELALAKTPPKKTPHRAVLLGTLSEVGAPAALNKHGHRSVYITTASVVDKLDVDAEFPEVGIPKREDDAAVKAVEKYYDKHVEELTQLSGMRSAHDTDMEMRFHASATLGELVELVTRRRYRVIALP